MNKIKIQFKKALAFFKHNSVFISRAGLSMIIGAFIGVGIIALLHGSYALATYSFIQAGIAGAIFLMDEVYHRQRAMLHDCFKMLDRLVDHNEKALKIAEELKAENDRLNDKLRKQKG